jgi:hypothetical protein
VLYIVTYILDYSDNYSMSNVKDYVKECSFCKEKILMSKQSGKWLPYNLNNGLHECQKKTTEVVVKKQGVTLDAVQKKLESIGITLDLDKLMNEK